jgi:hypothetical protein
MDWLIKLLGIEAPENAALHSAELRFRGAFPWWFAALLLAVLTVAVFWLYARERAGLGVFRKSAMALVRVALLALLLFLLLRPILLAEYQGERPQSVVLLLDNSQSMRQQDRRLSTADRLRAAIARGQVPPTTSVTDSAALAALPSHATDPERVELVRAILTNPQLQLVDGLQRLGPLRPFLFGQRLRGALDDAAGAPPGQVGQRLAAVLKADEPRTGLADAINDLLQRKDGDLPAALVVMTDGLDNASKLTLEDAARDCARLKVPLHIYGVGSSEGGSLQLKDVGIPDTLFHDDTVSVPLRWRAQGFTKGIVVVTLTLGGKVVAQRDVPVHDGVDDRAVLSFIPPKGNKKEENLDLVASVKLKGNDTFKDSVTRPVRLIDRKVRILYIENTPRWEYKFLQTALLRDRRVEASFLLVKAAPQVLHSGPPFLPEFPARDRLFAFDLLILGDVAAADLGKQHMEWLVEFVKEGGGLVVIAGPQHAPASFDGTPLADVLPVEFLPVKFKVESDARPQAFHPLLTDAGERADFLALADTPQESLKAWKDLPGFYWHYPVTKLRPGATALLVHPRAKMGEQPMPLLASHYYGKGQVLFLAVEETWRWRYNARDRYLARFWGQLIYQLGLPHLLGNSRRVQVALEHSEAVLDRQSSIYARLLDADYRPLKKEQVPAVLEYLDAKKGQEARTRVVLERVPDREGEYRCLLPNDRPGRFELKLTEPEVATFPYRVNLPPRHELEEANLAVEPLREAARLSGGDLYREEDLYRLTTQVQPRKTVFTQRQEVVLWNPLTMLLLVGLITLEWVLRKFANLS